MCSEFLSTHNHVSCQMDKNHKIHSSGVMTVQFFLLVYCPSHTVKVDHTLKYIVFSLNKMLCDNWWTPTHALFHIQHCISLAQRFSNFFQVGTTFISQNVLRTTFISQNVLRTTFISQNVLRTTLHLGLSNSLGLPFQCSKHVFATENPSYVVESRVGRVVNFIKCQSWERKFKDACCM